MMNFITNPIQVNILKRIHRILIQYNKTLDFRTIKLEKIYQIHLQTNKISTKTTNTGIF